MNKADYFLKKHSSTILTCIGASGVVLTAVLAVKETTKALSLIENAKEEKGEELTKMEVVQVAWKPYIPAIITGFSTIACIFGANLLNTRSQASLMSAYAVLDNAFKEYKNKVNELYEDTDINIKQNIIDSKFDDDIELEDGEVLFFDYQSMQFFSSTMEKVMNAENKFLESLHARGYACINEYYDYLGIPRVDYGYQLGWFDLENNNPYNCEELEFNYEKVMLKGRECFIITTNNPPVADYIL